ncbi:MAG: hypothetical protein QM734_05030 [Cyclobacteriaceae bacterium]
MRCVIFLLFLLPAILSAQNIRWSKDGNAYYKTESGEIFRHDLPANTRTIFLSRADLTPANDNQSLKVRNFTLSEDGNLVLIYTNSKKVWRLDTEGDYWV